LNFLQVLAQANSLIQSVGLAHIELIAETKFTVFR